MKNDPKFLSMKEKCKIKKFPFWNGEVSHQKTNPPIDKNYKLCIEYKTTTTTTQLPGQ